MPPVSSSRPRTPRHGRTRMTFRALPTRSTARPTAPAPAWRPSLSLRFRTNCTPVDFDLGLFVGTAAQSHHRCRRGTIACANHRTLSLSCHPSLGTGIAEICQRVDRNSFYRPARPCVLATGAGGDEAAAPTFRAAIRTAEAKFADAGGLATRIQLLRTTQHRAARRIVVSSSQLPLPAAESSALRRRIAEMIKGLLAAMGLAGLAAGLVVQGAIAAPIAPTAQLLFFKGDHWNAYTTITAAITRTITTIDIMRIGFIGMATGIITETPRRSDIVGARQMGLRTGNRPRLPAVAIPQRRLEGTKRADFTHKRTNHDPRSTTNPGAERSAVLT